MAKVGRPDSYTKEVGSQVCALIAEGKSLRTICALDWTPSAPTFFKWLREHEEFLKQYEEAKELQADAMAEDMLSIADDEELDPARMKLRIDTRKWLASKFKAKKYGDKIQEEKRFVDKDGNDLHSKDLEILAKAGYIKKGEQ